MNRQITVRRAAVSLLGIVVATAVISRALADQSGGAPRPAPAPRPEAPYGPPGPMQFRDPTQPSPEMRSAIEAEQFVPKPGDVAPTAGPTMPQVSLKARLIGALGEPTAMLDINGKMHTVHPGNEVPAGSGGVTVSVRDIAKDRVTLEILPLKKPLTVN